jgi:hypothetical protein
MKKKIVYCQGGVVYKNLIEGKTNKALNANNITGQRRE